MPARKRRNRKNRRGRPVLRWLLTRPLPVLALALFAYLGYQDYQVRHHFEGKRWALPARVYARPLELFNGLDLKAGEFEAELKALGYRHQARPKAPGTYRRKGNSFRVVSRGFDFWDGREAPRSFGAVFHGGRVRLTGKAELVRLDPLEIGAIYPSHNEDRVLVRLEDLPPLFIDALLAIEDRDFRDHFGISLKGIARALWANLRAGGVVQGGSTLTQQLAKNLFLTRERSIWRKLNEAVMALLLEWHYSKDEILEAYVNEVFLGQQGRRAIHGFGLASRFYFGRPIQELAPEHMAMLVGMVKGPSYYNPRRHPERALKRRNLVLQVLGERGLLSHKAVERAQKTALGVGADVGAANHFPAFLDLVRRQLRRDYRDEDLTSEGLRIFTTLDPRVQGGVEKALSGRILYLEKRKKLPGGHLQGAVVVTDPGNGEVLAVAGDRKPRYAGFNRALDAMRPVGSLIKPAVYLAALEQPQRYTLATRLDDGPLRLKVKGSEGVWAPKNYDGRFHGQVMLADALVHSYNPATVRLGLDVGMDAVHRTLARLGVERDMPSYPSLFLGAVSMSPLEVAQMYQTLAGGGFRTPLRAIRAVLTHDGTPLKRYPLRVERAFDPKAVYLLTHTLQRVVSEGTGAFLYRMLPKELGVAGKTGTTDDLRDSWFAGFSGDRLAVVWLGMDDNRPIKLSGGSGALLVWGDIMRKLRTQPLQPARPAGVHLFRLSEDGDRLAGEGCAAGRSLPFIDGSEPPRAAPCGSAGTRPNDTKYDDPWKRLEELGL
jgi:penicillin-binding protein 1B